ncbi:tetratricopeptide repeat protein [Sulfurovum sp.]|uniref:tetratricopeptide repeat protein n=1 Tax=Sulfurovum sp. TaxID=1969726 RepID=UPI002867FE58|nr:tetratricopeptide repeat protein [Sulfurovum sp.]
MFKIIISLTVLTLGTLTASNTKDLKVACYENNATACYMHAVPMVTGDNAKVQDIREEGMSYMRKACILGENRGCDKMGANYYKNANYHAAIPYLEKSCARGVKFGCEAMGTIYRDGHDVRQDDVKSREFYEQACDLKSGDACYNVAIIYRGGFGVVKSREKEKEFYKKGCDAGLKAGCMRFTDLDNEDKGIETGIWATIKSWFK